MTFLPPRLLETVSVGPWPFFFCNTNTVMKLKGHCHQAFLTIVYRSTEPTGYPSFKTTNDALRGRLRDLTGTSHPFRDATNEDVLRWLWEAFAMFRDPSWEQWDGGYTLHALHMDVLASDDRIGHDPGTTRYSIEALPEPVST